MDYYKVLEVEKTASADEIRKAYRRLSKKYHPDMKPDDKSAEEQFKKIQEAYDVLGNEEKRKQYDQFGPDFQRAAGGGPGGAHTYNWSGGQGGQPFDLNDIFGGQIDLGDLFGGGGFQGGPRGAAGGGRRAQRPTKGQDLEMEVLIPFHIAAEGGQYEVTLPKVHGGERLSVKIPAGVDTGSTIRLSGQGEQGQANGPRGDLMLKLRVAPHPYFRREGNNLLLETPLTITEAALGATVDVPTLVEGHVSLKIPPGTASGTKLRLKGKGIADRQTKVRGDQFVVVKIIPPAKLSAQAKELLEQLQTELTDDPRKGLW
ncbi:MAG: DnaJ C-terminal domain-containing protein [Planctomycetales bacterium]